MIIPLGHIAGNSANCPQVNDDIQGCDFMTQLSKNVIKWINVYL